MRASTVETAVRTGRLTRALIYAVLLVFVVYYLLPLFVMMVNSFKELDEIRGGNMLALPELATIAPWIKAWNQAQIGVQPTGLAPYFVNSIKMVVPAVVISTLLGALNGYVLTKWRFRGDTLVFALMLFACFIPFQIVLIPMARVLGFLGIAGTTWGLVLVHVVYGLRLHHALLPQLLRGVPDRAGEGGADRRGQLPAHLLSNPACPAPAPSSWSR